MAPAHGRIGARFSRDFLLRLVTPYWVSGTIGSSTRDYFNNRWHGVTLRPDDFVHVPTAAAKFTRRSVFEGDPPREWAQRLYNIRQWTSMAQGGHFAAAEEPVRLVRDIAAFFAKQ